LKGRLLLLLEWRCLLERRRLDLILRRIARKLRLLRRSLETWLLLKCRKASLLSLQLTGEAGGLRSKGSLLLRSLSK
jgi:hypothetical protein